jgi:arabinofuranosyltransferase
MFALIPARLIAGKAAAGAMGLSILCSVSAFGVLLFRGIANVWSALLAVLVLTLSKAFIDYSTSGLENPLSHLLLVLFFTEYFGAREKPWRLRLLFLYAALLAITRLDLALIVFVPIVQYLRAERPTRREVLRAAMWLAPFVLWELFSLLYYGFPFPNSYYAKLGGSPPRGALVSQGFYFLLNSLSWDPITLFSTGALVAFSATRRDDARSRCLAASVVIYLVYVISVGGDYMSGRFLTVPLFVAVLGLSKLEIKPSPQLYGGIAILALVGLTAPRPPVLSWDKYEGLGRSPQGTDDERGYRHADTALLLRNKEAGPTGFGGGWAKDGLDARERGDRVMVYRNIGYFGFFAGPTVHVIDPHGIGDPLMPRLPWGGGHWNTGHYLRVVPEGYTDAAIDRGSIKDPEVEAYWQRVKRVTRDPIFDGARLHEVLRFTFGITPGHAPTPKTPM